MARLALTVALLTLTATNSYAEESPTEEVTEVAVANGLDPWDLQGAVNWTGASPQAYVDSERVPVPAMTPRAVSDEPAIVSWPWTALARCESGGDWTANTGNGYFGGLQEDMTFWRTYGGTAYASRPDLAPPTAQVTVATRGQKVQGWGAWPRCSVLIGLRR